MSRDDLLPLVAELAQKHGVNGSLPQPTPSAQPGLYFVNFDVWYNSQRFGGELSFSKHESESAVRRLLDDYLTFAVPRWKEAANVI